MMSVIVDINPSYVGSITCNFIAGSTAEGCLISLFEIDSIGNTTFLFNINVTRDEPIVRGVVFEEVPDGSCITGTARDIQPGGSLGLISTPVSVFGPCSPTTTQPRESCLMLYIYSRTYL